MRVFMYTVQLPENVWDERIVKTVEEKKSDILLWTEKELTKYYSGEFAWKKIGMHGVCATQYVNLKTVRLIVRANSKDVADGIVRSYSWYLDQKKFHKRKYRPRQSGVVRKIEPSLHSITDGRAFGVE